MILILSFVFTLLRGISLCLSLLGIHKLPLDESHFSFQEIKISLPPQVESSVYRSTMLLAFRSSGRLLQD